MENTAESSGGFQDLLSAALCESGLTDDLDFSDLIGEPPASNHAAPAAAPITNSQPAAVANASSNWEAKGPVAAKQSEPSTEVDLFSQALQQLTAINKQAGAFHVPKNASTVATPQAPVTPVAGPVHVVQRPRMAQLIDTLPSVPRDEQQTAQTSLTQAVTSTPAIATPQPQPAQVAQPQILNQFSGLRTVRPSLVQTAIPGQQGMTVVRAIRPVGKPGTVMRTVRAVGSTGQQVVHTVQSPAMYRTVRTPGTVGQQIVRTVQSAGTGGQQIIRTVKAQAGQQIVHTIQTAGTPGQQIIRTVQAQGTPGQQIIRTVQAGGTPGQQIVRTVQSPGAQQIVRTVQASSVQGQQILRASGGNQQLIRTIQQVKGANSPIQIIQTRPNGSPITVSSAPRQIMVGQNNSVQVKGMAQTVQLGGVSANGQPRFATIVNSKSCVNSPQTISLLTAPRGTTTATSNNVTRIPAKIVQQIGPDGTTRFVRIVTVSPGMLQHQGSSKGITIAKMAHGAAATTVAGTAIRLPQRTIQAAPTATTVTNSPVTVVRPTLTPSQKVTIAPRPTIGNKVVVTSSVQQLSPLLQNRVIQPIRRVASPLTVQQVTNTSRAKSATPPPTNGVIKTQLSEKDVSRLWVNEEIKFKKLVRPAPTRSPSLATIDLVKPVVIEEEAEEEDEELGHAETYADYVPAKLRIGERHPDSVVETSSLSSVEPPDVWYKLSIPESTIDYGSLSALQLESIVYASQKHEMYLPSQERAGYLIGDGAGVGKGRTIAGIIFENYLQGRKRALWLSVSNDLRVDAERDLRDIGAGKIEVYPLNKFKYAKISSKVNGSVKKGVIFATYSSLIGESQSGGKYRTRLKQLLHWLNRDFDGVIVFDECHKAKNLCPVGSSKPTKTGMTVLELQNKLPKARIIYASATGASEPRNMAYMTRLGLWGIGTPFREFIDFINAVEKRGVGAMELVAMDMKLRGIYIARQLSFHGVTFKIQEIPVAKDFIAVYNQAVKLWVDARAKFQLCAELIDAEHRMKKSMWGQFWSAHQRFFKYLCISSKVPYCVKVARDAVKNGKCVVIGLQSTGEARTLEQLEDSGGELNDFVSTAKGVFQTLVEKHFPAPDRRKTLDMFGLGTYDSPTPSPKPQIGTKRKKEPIKHEAKKSKLEMSDDSDGSSDSSPSAASSESELSISDSDNMSDDGSDDFNPFGDGSDSDDDPWLKKSKAAAKKPKKEKKKKEKKKKEKKKKREKKVKDDSESEDIDDEFDRALEAAGLKGSSLAAANKIATANARAGESVLPGMDAVNRAVEMKRELLQQLEELGDRLPPNTLDQLIDELGGPESVAEMTGRKGRVVSTDDGIQYESRSEVDAPLEILNLTEKQRFMDGEKNIAIISEAASSGISLQADRRALNQRRRVHMTLELPWSADRAIQQFGRTHRSNQVSAPEYAFLISELAGERRFAATVAKRLESLGALTHGDRRATETRDLSQFNIDNKYGRAALEAVMKSVLHIEPPLVPPPDDYSGNFFDDVQKGLIGVGLVLFDERIGVPTLEKDYNNISKFLNRILGITVELQNALFFYFTETLTTIILQAKRNGRWDMGILDLGGGGENVRKLKSKNFTSNFSGTPVRTALHTVSVERGMTWEKAFLMWREHAGPDDGFYLSTQVRNAKRTAMLVISMSGRRKEKLYSVYRPNTGLQLRAESLDKIKDMYKKVLPDDAQIYWQDQFELSASVCSHAYWRGNCKRTSIGLQCEVGVRCRTYHILGGSVLGCWTKVEAVLASLPGGHASRMQIIRIRTDEGERIVGTLVPDAAIIPLTNLLSQDITKTPGAGGVGGSLGPSLSIMGPSSSSRSSSPGLSAFSQTHSFARIAGGSIQQIQRPTTAKFSPATGSLPRSASAPNSFQATFANSLGLNNGMNHVVSAPQHRVVPSPQPVRSLTASPSGMLAAATQNTTPNKTTINHLSMPLLL